MGLRQEAAFSSLGESRPVCQTGPDASVQPNVAQKGRTRSALTPGTTAPLGRPCHKDEVGPQAGDKLPAAASPPNRGKRSLGAEVGQMATSRPGQVTCQPPNERRACVQKASAAVPHWAQGCAGTVRRLGPAGQSGSATEASETSPPSTPVALSHTGMHSSQMAISPIGWTQSSTVQTPRVFC